MLSPNKNYIFEMRECEGKIIIKDSNIYVIYLEHIDYTGYVIDPKKNSIEKEKQITDFYNNHDANSLIKEYPIKHCITNFKGYFPYRLDYDYLKITGENLIVMLDDNNYILIQSGYGGPYIKKFTTADKIIYAFYTINSLSDPGYFFALGKKYIYVFKSRNELLCITRNKYIEKNVSNISYEIINMYLENITYDLEYKTHFI